jgi:hypothetical protein
MNIRTQTSSLIFRSTDNIVFRITYQGTVVDYELLAIESVVLGALYSLFQLDLDHTISVHNRCRRGFGLYGTRTQVATF